MEFKGRKCKEHDVPLCGECGMCPVHVPVTDKYPMKRDTKGRLHYVQCENV